MDTQVLVESIKGLWSVIGIIVTGVVAGIGFLVKESVAKKKKEELYKEEQSRQQKEYRDEQLRRYDALEEKVDRLIEILNVFAEETNQKLNHISEGLNLCMEDDELIFKAFRKTKLLNGESEAQSKKLAEFQRDLLRKSLQTFETIDFEKEVNGSV